MTEHFSRTQMKDSLLVRGRQFLQTKIGQYPYKIAVDRCSGNGVIKSAVEEMYLRGPIIHWVNKLLLSQE